MIGFFAFVVVTIVFYVKPLCDNCHAEVRLKSQHSPSWPAVVLNVEGALHVPNKIIDIYFSILGATIRQIDFPKLFHWRDALSPMFHPIPHHD